MKPIIELGLENYYISLEKEMSLTDRLKNQEFKVRFLTKAANVFGFTPQFTFEDEDVDDAVVRTLLKNKKYLVIIDEWILDSSYELLPELIKAKEVLNSITKPKKHTKYFRGFNIDENQQTFDLATKKWFGTRLRKDIKVGGKLEFTPTAPVSFTHFQPYAKFFGKVIISVDGLKYHNRFLHITNELVIALKELDDKDFRTKAWVNYHVSEAESLFLPDGKPLEFTIESIK